MPSASTSQARQTPVIPVVLCGGTGTRLWPLSRRALPKQFLSLEGDRTMLQDTAARFSTPDFLPPWYVCQADHRFLVAEQLQRANLLPGKIILEPCARGTAPAVALAAMAALDDPVASVSGDVLMLVTPADHVVRNAEELRRIVLSAVPSARAGAMVLFGVVPIGPEAGYGYIRAGDTHPAFGEPVRCVRQFVEKPATAIAEGFLAQGDYFWNSGMFLLSARRYLEELGQYRPDILDACKAAFAGRHTDLDFLRIDPAAFESCPAEAIDTAVMERTSHAAMLALDVGWSDVGTWSSLWDIAKQDPQANVVRGRVFAVDSENSYLRSDGPLLATLGVSDLLVVATEDAVMVAPRQRAQDLGMVVEALRHAECKEVENNRTVYRPWGDFRCVDAGSRFQVKHISVSPGARLSLQMHYHRAEHWVVIAGAARITRGDEIFLLHENESTYIPPGVKHRLENPGLVTLQLVEIQSGGYLGDDDIVRFDDDFGRN